MRVFLAVPCGEQFTVALTTALDDWRTGPGGLVSVRWTRPQTWHLTLQFLGDWPGDRLTELETALGTLESQPAFSLTPGLVGGFPNLKSPRVLFLHMVDDGHASCLAAGVRAVVDATWGQGPQDYRPFRCHLTLARIRERLPQADIKLLQEMKLDVLPPVLVEGFSLVASELRKQGPRYTTLAKFALRK
jgi:2'-5' RNA ligase